tara:strand:- start:65 stop:1033 length:969 start_codon:yes stop_codon:yes gene_type:complete
MLFIVCLLLFFACQNNTSGNFPSSLDSLSFLLSKDSLNITLLNERSKLYIRNNELILAKKDIDNAYALFKNDCDLLLHRGAVYYELNQTRISRESWRRCLKIEPNNLDCREKLTNLLCAVQHPNCKAMIDTIAIINNGIVSATLIIYLKELEAYDMAINLLENKLMQIPEEKETLSLLSILYSDTSSSNNMFDAVLAEHYFKQIIGLYPNYDKAYYNFAKFKQDVFEYEEAIHLYRISIDLNPDIKENYYNMGFCHMQLGKNVDAINDFTHAINLDSSFLLAYHARAYLYGLIGETDKARIDWKNCLMLNPSYIPAINALSS